MPALGAITWPANGASLSGATDTLRWNANPDAYGYQVWVGSTPQGNEVGYYPAGFTTDTQIDMTGLPTDGRPLYVTVWSATMGGYMERKAMYYAKGPQDVGIPTPLGYGWALPGPSQAFGSGAGWPQGATFSIGNSVGSTKFGFGSQGGLQDIFTNLPVDGRALFGRLHWNTTNGPRFRDYPMTAALPGPAAVMNAQRPRLVLHRHVVLVHRRRGRGRLQDLGGHHAGWPGVR